MGKHYAMKTGTLLMFPAQKPNIFMTTQLLELFIILHPQTFFTRPIFTTQVLIIKTVQTSNFSEQHGVFLTYLQIFIFPLFCCRASCTKVTIVLLTQQNLTKTK